MMKLRKAGCGTAALMDSLWKQKAVSTSLPTGLEERANSRAFFTSSTSRDDEGGV
jgi:hypothetical protein